jgi:hypothetical protein
VGDGSRRSRAGNVEVGHGLRALRTLDFRLIQIA